MTAPRRFSTTFRWLLPLSLGVLIGLSGLAFIYARGLSYFRDDPRACLNCHIMRDTYDDWNRGSHKAVANCNSCHTPHNFFGKYAVKAINGWNHSQAFTSGHMQDPLRIRPFNRQIAVANCVRCHLPMVDRMVRNAGGQQADCLHCHGNVGHGTRR